MIPRRWRRRIALALCLLLLLGALPALRAWRVDRPHGIEALLARASASASGAAGGEARAIASRAPRATGATIRDGGDSGSAASRPSAARMGGDRVKTWPARVVVRSGSMVGTWIDHDGTCLDIRSDGTFGLTLPGADGVEARSGRYRVEDDRLRIWWDGDDGGEDDDSYEVTVDRDALVISSRAEGVHMSIEVLLQLRREPQGNS